VKLSIVVPCFNEADNISLILSRFSQAIGSREDIEVLLVNNGSTDNTAQVMAELVPDYSFVRVVDVQVNQGYGFGVVSGLKEACGEFIGWTHADMQTDPMDIVKALLVIENSEVPHKTYAKGLRKGRPFMDCFFTVGMSIFESIYMTTLLWDINAQPNIFHRSFFDKWDSPPDDFSLDLYALYKAKKFSLDVQRFEVKFPERIHGFSKWNTGFASKWKFIKRTLSFSLKLKKEL
jgi:glycosyltransferase involved in cell wall biosynthesis